MSKDKKQRHDADKDKMPTAGPDYDDRSPEPGDQKAAEGGARLQLAHDLHARILGVSIDGDRTGILIGSGEKQGIVEGMQGYIPTKGGGVMADFIVVSVAERTCKAFVDLTPDQIHETGNVIVNPASTPAPAKHQDQKARIIGVSIQNGQTHIMIGNGRLHGAWPGEHGVLVDKGGRKQASFTLERVDSRVSHAIVPLIPDALRDLEVILNPTDPHVQAEDKTADKKHHHHGAHGAPHTP